MEDNLHNGIQTMQEVVNQFDVTGSLTGEEIDQFVENFANEAAGQSGTDHKAQDAALAELYGYLGVWQSLDGQIQELSTEVFDRREQIDALMTQYGLSGSSGGPLPTELVALLNEQDADMNELNSLMGSMGDLVQSLYDMNYEVAGPDNWPDYEDD